ncbi:hypothetical protein VNO77_24151 [Canavalia gladiata]|uniref:Two-component response regulator n=1 Tax=Canavalia gladiata TaxID=3824 RepID=A0AAN9L920_CANGL
MWWEVTKNDEGFVPLAEHKKGFVNLYFYLHSLEAFSSLSLSSFTSWHCVSHISPSEHVSFIKFATFGCVIYVFSDHCLISYPGISFCLKMTVGSEDMAGDRFPVGMRVLAVDDDQTCLKVLEKLLRKCKYNVTTTTQSIKALEILRKNKNKFDLVISDVNMPEMDGFKLLELVGLEMDLPVIMLSGYGDKEWVMKGVIHGACDYLMKPVRIEELQNIWQHVVRRKIDCKDKNKSPNEEKAYNMTRECSQAIVSENNADQNTNLGQKRKAQSEVEAEEEDDQENEHENEEPSNQKKPRLVWAAELHSKFVAAVNQLGIDKAFPKRILDLMNVEGLTRENVASHLQKYRLGLKKPTQPASMVGAMGNSDPYLQMGSVEGYVDFCTSSGSGRMLNTTLPSYASGGMFRRLNSPSGLNMRGLTSSGLVQPVQSQNMNSPIKSLGNMQRCMFSANQTSGLLQGIPTSIEVSQFQQNNCSTGVRKLSPIDDSSGFKVSSGFSDSRATVSNANNSLPGLSGNSLLLQGNSSPAHTSGAFRNPSSLGATSVNKQSFDPGICGSSNMLDYNRCKESWQSSAQISNFPANTSSVGNVFNNDQLPQNSLHFSSSTFHGRNNPVDFSSTSAIAVPLEDARGELQCQEGLLGNILLASCYNNDISRTFNSKNSLISPNGISSSLGHSLDQNNSLCSKGSDASLVGQLNGVNPSIAQSSEVEKFYSMKSNDASILQPKKSQEGLIQNSVGSMDDIMSNMVKLEQNGMTLMDGEIEFDVTLLDLPFDSF